MTEDWARESALDTAFGDEDLRRDLGLALADIRAAPDNAWSTIWRIFELGWQRGWDDREAHELPTVPPVAPDG